MKYSRDSGHIVVFCEAKQRGCVSRTVPFVGVISDIPAVLKRHGWRIRHNQAHCPVCVKRESDTIGNAIFRGGG